MAQIGCDLLAAVVPVIEVVCGNSVESIAEEGSAQLVSGLRLLDDPFHLLYGDIGPPLADERSQWIPPACWGTAKTAH
jgi:hypothetical protein